MKRKGLKGILAIVLVFVMSFGFGVTSFAGDYNTGTVFGELGAELELESGIKIKVTKTDFYGVVRSWINDHRYIFSDSDADNAVSKMKDAKKIIKENSKAKTAEEFYNEFYYDEEFQATALKAINEAAKAIHCYIGIEDGKVFVEEYNDDTDDEDTPHEIQINDDLNAAIANVVLNNGTIIDLTKTAYHNHAWEYFKNNKDKYNESDVKAALVKIENVKNIIRDSGVKSADELRKQFSSDKEFAKQINDVLLEIAETLGDENFWGLQPDGSVYTVKDRDGDDEEDEDTDNEPVETPTPAPILPVQPPVTSDTTALVPVAPAVTPTPITAVTSPAPATQVTSPAPVTSATKPDSAAANSSEPIIKVTGYNFIFIALAVGAFVLLVAGCVIIARRKKLFS